MSLQRRKENRITGLAAAWRRLPTVGEVVILLCCVFLGFAAGRFTREGPGEYIPVQNASGTLTGVFNTTTGKYYSNYGITNSVEWARKQELKK